MASPFCVYAYVTVCNDRTWQHVAWGFYCAVPQFFRIPSSISESISSCNMAHLTVSSRLFHFGWCDAAPVHTPSADRTHAAQRHTSFLHKLESSPSQSLVVVLALLGWTLAPPGRPPYPTKLVSGWCPVPGARSSTTLTIKELCLQHSNLGSSRRMCHTWRQQGAGWGGEGAGWGAPPPAAADSLETVQQHSWTFRS